MTTANKTVKSVLSIVIAVIVSKWLGFIRDILIAAKFGSAMETDAYFVATIITQILIAGVAGSISITLVPVLSELNIKSGDNKEIRLMNNIINIVLIASFVLLAINWISAPIIVRVIANGFEGEKYHLTVFLSRILFLSTIFMLLTPVFQGYLRSNNRFTIPSAVGIPFNLVQLIFLVFLSQRHGIVGLGVATIIACFSQLLLNILPSFRLDYSYKFVVDFKDKYLRKTLYLIVPIVISSMIKQINILVDRMLASYLVEGSISALNYADRINTLVFSTFITGITVVIYPMMSKYFIKDDFDSFNKTMNNGIITVLSITIPATVALMLLAEPIVKVLFERGAFDEVATKMTSEAVFFYSIGLSSLGVIHVLNKVFYSRQDTKTPMINGLIAISINITLNFLLINSLKHAGLALASSISLVANCLLLISSLKRKDKRIMFNQLKPSLVKIFIASFGMGAILYPVSRLFVYCKGSFITQSAFLGTCILAGLLVYITLCYFMKVKELMFIYNKVFSVNLKRKLLKH